MVPINWIQIIKLKFLNHKMGQFNVGIQDSINRSMNVF